ncbi:MAG: hypothetical protein KDC44_11475 [Phaeodactylibacter sp.]|nr:hypothetical protein [Phaeodactylibacter sp.]
MILELSKSFTHTCGSKSAKKYSEEEVKNLLSSWMERNGVDPSTLQFTKDGTLQIEESPNLKLHSLILQAEEMGLEMKYTKKTLIGIC